MALLAYGALAAALYLGQRRMMYRPPETVARTPESMGFPEASNVRIRTADGQQLVCWFAPPREGRPLVIFFHGNAELISWRVKRFKALTEDGDGLLAVSFRGYAGSTGTPTEAGLISDGEAAYRFAAARYPSNRIALWGYSLGTGVAVRVAAAHPVAKLVLEAPYTSALDVAEAHYPFVPARWLMLDRFLSMDHIRDVRAPLLVLHGDRDRVVPSALGKKLFDAANEPKRFVRFPEGSHVNLDDYGATSIARRFLSE